jgi:di/tricarboxylate transporter
MSVDAIIVIAVIIAAVVLFIKELFTVDTVALLILVTLVLTGIVSPNEAAEGFSNNATLTVLFMFILSAALFKTGALQQFAVRISSSFKGRYYTSMALLMLFVAFISAFINNTPVVAVFIPVVLQISRVSGIPASKMLIPVSFATIFGGTCSVIGTSTNILVSGIAEANGLPAIPMFQMLPMGLIIVGVGMTYMLVVGFRLLPDRSKGKNLEEKFRVVDYLTDVEILPTSPDVGVAIMQSQLANKLELDVIELQRSGTTFSMPSGDMILQAHDVLKVRCDIGKIRAMKEQMKALVNPAVHIGGHDLSGRGSTLVELIIPSDSDFEGKTLKDVDFRRSFRAAPLAIRHREEVLHDHLYSIPMKAGDVILAEIKTHFVEQLRKDERSGKSPFILLSESTLIDFKKKQFAWVMAIVVAVIALAAFEIVPIMIGAITAVVLLVISKSMTMKEAYESVSWQVIFLLAGALSLGKAMSNSGLDQTIAQTIIGNLGVFGPVAILSGLYLATAVLTELMSNNATAALLAPIAIATAHNLGLSPTPFLMAVTFAASASFATPIGYQTNTMVYTAGEYKFTDFLKVGSGLGILFWILATIFIPIFFPF